MNQSTEIDAAIAKLLSNNEDAQLEGENQLLAFGEAAIPALYTAIVKDTRNEELQAYERPILRIVFVKLGETAIQFVLRKIEVAASNPILDNAQRRKQFDRADVRLLGYFDDPRSIPAFMAIFNADPASNATHYAMRELGSSHFHSREAFELLRTLLKHQSIVVASQAAVAIARYHDLSVLDEIEALLKRPGIERWFDFYETVRYALREISKQRN